MVLKTGCTLESPRELLNFDTWGSRLTPTKSMFLEDESVHQSFLGFCFLTL